MDLSHRTRARRAVGWDGIDSIRFDSIRGAQGLRRRGLDLQPQYLPSRPAAGTHSGSGEQRSRSRCSSRVVCGRLGNVVWRMPCGVPHGLFRELERDRQPLLLRLWLPPPLPLRLFVIICDCSDHLSIISRTCSRFFTTPTVAARCRNPSPSTGGPRSHRSAFDCTVRAERARLVPVTAQAPASIQACAFGSMCGWRRLDVPVRLPDVVVSLVSCRL